MRLPLWEIKKINIQPIIREKAHRCLRNAVVDAQ